MGSVDRVRDYLRSQGMDQEIREFDSSTKTSALAAEALGCSLGEIAKSVVFRGGRVCVVVISGDRRVSTEKLGALLGESCRVADADEVREGTGYPIGGVPPFPHRPDVLVLVDRSLARFTQVWAAAGAPNAVFRAAPDQLLKVLQTEPRDLSA